LSGFQFEYPWAKNFGTKKIKIAKMEKPLPGILTNFNRLIKEWRGGRSCFPAGIIVQFQQESCSRMFP
jgi:hypothetical protein